MAEEMTNTAAAKESRKEVTVKFGKGLAKPFTAKDGRELMEIRIPNKDPEDKRPWETFVLPAKFVHDNQYGSGLWFKLPEEGTTMLTRSVAENTENGREWRTESRNVSNTELKALVENYKNRDRNEDRAVSAVQGKGQDKTAPEKASGKRESVNETLAALAKETVENMEKRKAERAKDAGKKKTASLSR